MIQIFGDSNVSGWMDNAMKPLQPNKVWTLILKSKLQNREISINGQPGRIGLQSSDEFNKFISQNAEITIICIGVNDLRENSAIDVLNQINMFFTSADTSKNFYILHPGVQINKLKNFWDCFQDIHEKEKEFSLLINQIKATVVDLRGLDVLGEDGIHFSIEGHQMIADIMYDIIQE